MQVDPEQATLPRQIHPTANTLTAAIIRVLQLELGVLRVLVVGGVVACTAVDMVKGSF